MRLFSERELKIIVVAVAGATIIAVVGAILVSIARNRDAPARAVVEPAPEPEVPLRVSDLEFPPEYREITVSHWYLHRTPRSEWSAEEISEYWSKPPIVDANRLKSESDAFIRSLFEQVP